LTRVFVFVLLVHCFKYYDSLDPCCPNLRRYIQTSVGTFTSHLVLLLILIIHLKKEDCYQCPLLALWANIRRYCQVKHGITTNTNKR